METESNSTAKHKHKQDERNSDDHDHNKDIFKKMISKHPLYRLLLENHLQCLKVGGFSANPNCKLRMELERHCSEANTETCDGSTELDLFMEAYSFALGKLKEAMEEPQSKSQAFIDDMHTQLRELRTTGHPLASIDESVGSSKFSGGSTLD